MRTLTDRDDRSNLESDTSVPAQMTPRASSATKKDTRAALLEAGMEIMLLKGYTNTGIQEVLSCVGVPKGSFYHYFSSKEDFAVAIIRHYDEFYSAKLLRTLRAPNQTPLERLRNYCENSRANLLAQQCKKGCLIGNLGQEMADQSETLRTVLAEVMDKWRGLFADCIREGQESGEIRNTFPPENLAELFLASWDGAVLRSKITKCTGPLDQFLQLMFDGILT